ncbi:MAG: hypothetical protein U9N45_03600 [Gemmatimonadota bacterium]|nr:hypothetical protein [Gemmatimonadota bacterium]
MRVQRKIAGIKRLTSTLAQMDKTRSTMLPRGLIGQKVNLMI